MTEIDRMNKVHVGVYKTGRKAVEYVLPEDRWQKLHDELEGQRYALAGKPEQHFMFKNVPVVIGMGHIVQETEPLLG